MAFNGGSQIDMDVSLARLNPSSPPKTACSRKFALPRAERHRLAHGGKWQTKASLPLAFCQNSRSAMLLQDVGDTVAEISVVIQQDTVWRFFNLRLIPN